VEPVNPVVTVPVDLHSALHGPYGACRPGPRHHATK